MLTDSGEGSGDGAGCLSFPHLFKTCVLRGLRTVELRAETIGSGVRELADRVVLRQERINGQGYAPARENWRTGLCFDKREGLRVSV